MLLFDTHIFIWFLQEKLISSLIQLLSQKSQQGDTLFISQISLWEIALKSNLLSASGERRLIFHDRTKPVPQKEVLDYLETSWMSHPNTELLQLQNIHLKYLLGLPYPSNGHRDPFDRLLVSQALAEDLEFVTADAALQPYFAAKPQQLIMS